jgi:hypothetical protein
MHIRHLTTCLLIISFAMIVHDPSFAAEPAHPASPATRTIVTKLPPKEKLHLYVLMGQSNMAGRGIATAEDTTPHPRVIMLNLEGNWEQAIEPLTRDKPKMAGVGPALAFGKAMAEHAPADVTIGLVPCAVGGTALAKWQKGEKLYEDAVRRAKQAAEVGTLMGVVWHQGESEAGDEKKSGSYDERWAKMIADFRTDVAAPKLPVVVGELGEYLYDRTGNKSPFARLVNERIDQIPQRVAHTAVASSKGLKHKGDELHFDADSQREFGRRYAAAMIRLQSAAARP